MVTAFKVLDLLYLLEVLSMLTRQEREQTVLDLYNQGKTIREIAKEIRMSFRDIGAVLKKEEKEKERQKRQLENNIDSSDSDNTQSGMSLHRLKPTNYFPKVKLQ